MIKKIFTFSLLFLFLIINPLLLGGCSKKYVFKKDVSTNNNDLTKEVNNPVDTEDVPEPALEISNPCEGKFDGEGCELSFKVEENGEIKNRKVPGICRKIKDSESIVCKSPNSAKKVAPAAENLDKNIPVPVSGELPK